MQLIVHYPVLLYFMNVLSYNVILLTYWMQSNINLVTENTYLPDIPLFMGNFVSKHCLLRECPDCALHRILCDVH